MKIKSATITEMPKTIIDPMPQVVVMLDNDTVKILFAYYPDEISFTPDEFIGLTVAEAHALKLKKDREWLKS